MKVLKKNEIQAQIALERKQAIDESVDIATKTDQLRRDHASMQNQHEVFLAGMKHALERELGPLQQEKTTLLFELENLRKERSKEREPLDKEWESVRNEKSEGQKRLQMLNEREALLIRGENMVENERKGLASEAVMLENMHQDLISELDDASNLKKEANRVLTASKTIADQRTFELDRKESELGVISSDLTYKNETLDAREQGLNGREKALNQREKFINDKYATLERTVKRLQK